MREFSIYDKYEKQLHAVFYIILIFSSVAWPGGSTKRLFTGLPKGC